MNDSRSQAGAYREQMIWLAQSLAAARSEEVLAVVAAGTNPEHVRMFTDDNVDKRFEKLHKQVEFISAAFDDLGESLSDYIHEIPLSSYDTGSSDGERFLQWLEKSQELSPEQRDVIACQRARHAVENMGRENRMGHVRFQELWSMAGQLAGELKSNRQLRLQLNPIRLWSVFESGLLLDDDAVPPADVLFFAVGNEVRTAVLESSGKIRIDELSRLGVCTFDDWMAWYKVQGIEEHPRSEELSDFCRDLSEMGLLAFR